MEIKAYHIIVKGKVQGVFYRKSTQQKAIELRITGWVRNLKDGSVEMEAEGTTEALDELIIWCKEGPKNAVVTGVEVEEITPKNTQNFRII